MCTARYFEIWYNNLRDPIDIPSCKTRGERKEEEDLFVFNDRAGAASLRLYSGLVRGDMH